MKGVTIGLVLLLLISVLMPQSLRLMPIEDGTVIMSLDVCSAHSGYTKSALDLPFLTADETDLYSPCLFCFKEPENIRLVSLILPDRMEHPPRS